MTAGKNASRGHVIADRAKVPLNVEIWDTAVKLHQVPL